MTEESWIAKDPRAQKPRAMGTRGSFAGESGANQQAPPQPNSFLLVQAYAWRGLMAASRIRSTAVAASSDCEAWPYLDEGVLRPSRSRKVCMTCHWFRHHAGAECIPVLTCH
jgi:hypothetical protein